MFMAVSHADHDRDVLEPQILTLALYHACSYSFNAHELMRTILLVTQESQSGPPRHCQSTSCVQHSFSLVGLVRTAGVQMSVTKISVWKGFVLVEPRHTRNIIMGDSGVTHHCGMCKKGNVYGQTSPGVPMLWVRNFTVEFGATLSFSCLLVLFWCFGNFPIFSRLLLPFLHFVLLLWLFLIPPSPPPLPRSLTLSPPPPVFSPSLSLPLSPPPASPLYLLGVLLAHSQALISSTPTSFSAWTSSPLSTPDCCL